MDALSSTITIQMQSQAHLVSKLAGVEQNTAQERYSFTNC